jgi:cyanoexosortase A
MNRPELTSTGVVGLRDRVAAPRWIIVVFLILVLGDLFLVYRHESSGQFGITMVCWMAVWMSLGRRPPAAGRAGHGWMGLVLGGLLLGGLLVGILRTGESWTPILALYPLWAGIALSLVAGGFLGPVRYWRELLILFFLGIPHGFLLGVVNLSRITAQFAAFLLHYMGREVRLTGTEIALPGGAVEVVKSCDGTGAMAYLACLAVVFLVLFPTNRWQRVIMVPLAVGIAFLTNGLRVALLAIIESSAGPHSFDYWHTGTGAMLWTGLPVLLFGLICFAVLHCQSSPTTPEIASKGVSDSQNP